MSDDNYPDENLFLQGQPEYTPPPETPILEPAPAEDNE